MVFIKEIFLNGKQGKGIIALVDEDDYANIAQFKWYVTKNGQGDLYSYRNEKDSSGRLRSIMMHRMIMNAPNDKQVDHKNHNTLDNRKENLRLCTPRENQCNIRGHKNTSSEFKGVTFRKKYNYYEAYIDRKFLGLFTSEEAAANCYNYFANKYHGEFALFNECEFMTKDVWEKYKIIKKTNKYHGVSTTENNRWRVRLSVNGKEINLGRYDDEIEAAKVYNEFVIENNLNKKLNDIKEIYI